MNRVRLALVSLACLMASAAAHAQTTQQEVILSVTPDEMAKILQDIGYRAEILKNDQGKRRIRTRIGGWNVTLNFYSCDDKENCKSIGVRSFFENEKKRSAQWANDWNREKRFTKVYIDKDNDVNIEYDFLFRDGVTKGNIRAYFDVYEDQLKDFVEALKK
ncbi:MAG TPA: YbjN domain-containing protein [Beijerinckiaceae bacterium]|jgi:hypothetical protein